MGTVYRLLDRVKSRSASSSVLGFYRRTLRDLIGAGTEQSGAVTLVQRCSSDLRLNPQFHSIVLDGGVRHRRR